MSVKKIVGTLLAINCIQFLIGVILLMATSLKSFSGVNKIIIFAIALMISSSLLTMLGLYLENKYKNRNLEESIHNLEELNTKMRAQRHDCLNHLQVVYGLLELKEYEETQKYLAPVFKDITKVNKAMKTAQPAINALLQAKYAKAERHGIDMYIEVKTELKDIPLEAWDLCKILANVIDNAITCFTEETGEKNIHIEIDQFLGQYVFSITNNGPEIPKEQQKQIFRQGYSTKQEEDHGMGLYIVSNLVKSVKGQIGVSSKKGETKFTVTIPK